MKLLIGTNNQKKLKEMKTILTDINIELLTLEDVNILTDVEEHGLTFSENALLKAKEYYKLSKLPTIADDSGLVVESLEGAPGVFSARYSGVEGELKDNANIDKLLFELDKRERAGNIDRSAYFACSIALIDENSNEYVVEGKVHGRISKVRKGENGFGYDPVFILDGYDGLSMAEIDTEIKNQISHRAIALTKIKEVLKRHNYL